MLTRDQRWVKSFACLNQRNILYHERFESKIFSKYPKTFYLVCIEIRKNNLLSETLQNLCHLQMSTIVNFSRNLFPLFSQKIMKIQLFPPIKLFETWKPCLGQGFFIPFLEKKKRVSLQCNLVEIFRIGGAEGVMQGTMKQSPRGRTLILIGVKFQIQGQRIEGSIGHQQRGQTIYRMRAMTT